MIYIYVDMTISWACNIFNTGPPGQLATFVSVAPGTYSVRATARSGFERTELTFRVVVPEDIFRMCSVNLINSGVEVVGDTATVQFAGVGPVSSFECKLDGNTVPNCEM